MKSVGSTQTGSMLRHTTESYLLEYFRLNKGFVPCNYAIGTKVVTA